MTDATPTPATPAAAPAAAGPAQTMSIVGFILGIAAFIFAWTGIIGIGAGIAAIIVSRKAKKSEPGAPTWMGTVALIGGIIGIVGGVIFGILYIVSIIASFLLPAAVLGGVGNY